MEKIMVVDDDANICELIKLALEGVGYTVFSAGSGEECLGKFEKVKPNLLLLDVMLPAMDGWDVCRELRKVTNMPIIMLTAKGETFDKVQGLEMGADDYIVKPFDTKEVIARIGAVLRRFGRGQPQIEFKELKYDNLSLNLNRYELVIGGVLQTAPPKELELLYRLAANPNKVFTRDELLDSVWGFEYYGDSRTIDVHIKRLREKLENASEQWQLKTVWGVGYKFELITDGNPQN